MLGLGTKLTKSKIVTPGIVTDSLVMKHMYPAGAVQPLSDGAAYFAGAGADNYIQVSDTADLDGGTGDLSISFWMKAGSAAYSDKIVDKWTQGGSAGYFILVSSDGKIRPRWDDNSNNVVDTAVTVVADDTWHHVTVVWEHGANHYVYVDGVLDDTVDISSVTGSVANTQPFRIGMNNSTSEDFTGYLCNMGVWNRTLTQAEIKSIMWKQYADLSTTETTNLVSWWSMDDAVNVALNSLDSLSGSNELANSSLSVSDVAVQGANSIAVGTIASLEANEIKVTYINNDDGVKISLSSSNGGVFTSNLVVNTVYQLKLKAKINSGNANLRLYDGSNTYILDNISNTEYQEYTYNFAAKNATSAYINQEALGSGQIFHIKDISLKAYPGDSPHGVLS
jgi:hypothetical protein